MKLEIPELKRCCCCIPLRYGLLTWGYLKMLVALPVVAYIALMIYFIVIMRVMFTGKWFCVEAVVGVALILLLLTDMALTIVFLIGGHIKSVQLLRVFYIYSLVIYGLSSAGLIISCILQIIFHSIMMGHDNKHSGFLYTTSAIYSEVLITIVSMAMNGYFLLLLRSEIIKLKTNHNFRFSNHMADALCAMESGPAIEALEQIEIENKISNDDKNVDLLKNNNAQAKESFNII